MKWISILSVGLLLVACSSNDVEARFDISDDEGDTNTVFEFDASPSISTDTEIVGYAWDFGDGSSGTGQVVTHIYDTSGDYQVTLTITNENGSQASSSQIVSVNIAANELPVAVIDVSPTSGTVSTRFNFDGTASFDPDGDPDDPNVFRDDDYTWNLGDGTIAEGAQVGHIYDSPGEYEVRLTVRDPDNATSSSTVSVTVSEVSTRVRAVHAAPDVGSVDVGSVDVGINDTVLTGVPYAAASNYVPVAADTVTVTVTPEGSAEPALSLERPVATDRAYTAIALGTADPADDFPLETLFFAEDNTTLAAGEFSLSVVHAAAGAPEVDVYLLSGELGDDSLADPDSVSPITLAYKSLSPTLSLPVSNDDAAYRVIITPAGEGEVVYDSGLLTDALQAGVSYTAVAAIDTAEDALSSVQLILLTDQADTPFVTLGNVNVRDEGSNDTPAEASALGTLAQDASLRAVAAIDEQGDVDIFAFNVSEATEITARTQSQALGSSVDTILTFHSADGTPLLSNDDANDDANDETLDSQVTVLVPAGDFLVSVREFDPLYGEPAAFYDLIISSDEIRDNDLPDYGASAGTFTGASNAPDIAAFNGNALAVSAVQQDGDPLEQPLVILVDTPTETGLPILFDAAEVGVLDVILTDLSGQSRLVATQAMTPQAVKTALGGTFTFNFPGETIERTVDASATLAVPTVTAVERGDSSVTITFEAVAGATNNEVEVFGRSSAAAARTAGSSPITVPVSVTSDEAIVVSVTSSDRSALRPPLTSTQRNVSQYLYYSEHAE